MGYTHYWTQTRDFTHAEMNEMGEAIRAIIATSGVPIRGGRGTGEPEFTDDHISFNGQGPDNDHETFYIQAVRELPYEGADPSRLGWAFCKTAYKPYDIVVTACLTYLQSDWEFEVSSDGDIPDWTAGVELAQTALNRLFANPLVVEKLVG